MSTTSKSTEEEVEGSIVSVIHVDDSGTDPERTVLALATKDDLSITIDEDDNDFNPAVERRTRRYRTNNTIDIEVSTAISTDQAALELLGITDTDGRVTFDSSARELGADVYLEIAYWDYEPDFANDDPVADSELLHRASDVEINSPEIDPSESPPMVSFTAWVEGYLDVSAEALGA